jgi:lysozyme family protein
MQLTPTVRLGYSNLWNRAKVLPRYRATLERICAKFIANRARYETIEKATGVPWWWVACVHERESSCNFSTHLANGDPLNHKTVHVPAGRGPFATWEDGAIDAVKYKGLHRVTDWSLPAALYWFEAYNGWGYVQFGVNSPYVWSFTDQYTTGKYYADGKYASALVDPQPGCAAMLKILLTLVPGLLNVALQQGSKMSMPSPLPTAPISASSTSGLNTSNGAILSTVVASITSTLFGSGSALAILLHGQSWWHVASAGLTLVAGLGAAAAPVVSLLNSNAGAIVNTVAAAAGSIVSNVDSSPTQQPATAPVAQA